MKLKHKTMLVLASVIAFSVFLNYGVLKTVVFSSYVELERDQAQDNLNRVLDAVNAELRGMTATTGDWASWDDTYEFAADRNESYVEENLYFDAMSTLNMNLMYIYDTSGEILFGKVFDLESGDELPTDDFLLNNIPPSHPLLRHPDTTSRHRGIALTALGPMLFTSHPILTNNDEGPIRGSFIMGRFLTQALVDLLRDQTHVNFELLPADREQHAPRDREILRQIEASDGPILRETGEDTISAYSLLRDFAGAPAILLRVDTPKDITAIGIKTGNFAVLMILGAGVLALFVMGVLLERTVIGPVQDFTKHISSIIESKDLSQRMTSSRSDEIGLLSKEFNGMLAQLQDAQRQLSEQAFQSGLAEMATGVLHNVRNQLSPLILGIGRLKQVSSVASQDKLDVALAELSDDGTPEDRRKILSQYVKLSTDNLVARQNEVQDQLDTMTQQLAKIDKVLAEQDQISRAERLVEPVKLSEVLSEVIDMTPGQAGKEMAVRVDPNANHLKPVLAERFLLKQVLVSLFTNAAEAIAAGDAEVGDIDVRVALDSVDGREMAHLQIRDNGRGIRPEDLTRIFQRGFTTKRDSNSGLGLHWCANSMVRMKGSIEAESEGPGRGTVMHIYLPVVMTASKAA